MVAVKKQAERLAASPAGRVAAAAKGPVERCLRLPDLFTVGIGHLVLARRLPSGALGCGFFLVDIYCMGVKEAFYREMAPSEFDETVEALSGGGGALVDMDPAAAKKLVTEAVACAAEAGIPPPKDYRVASRIFGDIDASASTGSFTFGVNGKPLYIQGRNDSPMRVRAIMATLNRSRGAGGWDATLVIGDDILDVESPVLDAEGYPIDDDDPEDEDDALAIEDQRDEEPERARRGRAAASILTLDSPHRGSPRWRPSFPVRLALAHITDAGRLRPYPLGENRVPSRLAGMGPGCPSRRSRDQGG